MTEEEITQVVYDEELDETNLDWEEKLIIHSENQNKFFKRIYIEEKIYI